MRKYSWSRKIFFLLSLLVLSGCGQIGPLFLPSTTSTAKPIPVNQRKQYFGQNQDRSSPHMAENTIL